MRRRQNPLPLICVFADHISTAIRATRGVLVSRETPPIWDSLDGRAFQGSCRKGPADTPRQGLSLFRKSPLQRASQTLSLFLFPKNVVPIVLVGLGHSL